MAGMVVDPDGVRAHASKVGWLAGDVAAAEAGAASTVGTGAFGVLCGFLGVAIDALSVPAQAAVSKAGVCLGRQVGNLTRLATLVEQTDAEQASAYRKLGRW